MALCKRLAHSVLQPEKSHSKLIHSFSAIGSLIGRHHSSRQMNPFDKQHHDHHPAIHNSFQYCIHLFTSSHTRSLHSAYDHPNSHAVWFLQRERERERDRERETETETEGQTDRDSKRKYEWACLTVSLYYTIHLSVSCCFVGVCLCVCVTLWVCAYGSVSAGVCKSQKRTLHNSKSKQFWKKFARVGTIRISLWQCLWKKKREKEITWRRWTKCKKLMHRCLWKESKTKQKSVSKVKI